MKHAQYMLALGVALMLLWSHANPVSAQDGEVAGTEYKASAPSPLLFGSLALDDEVLDGQRGGADTQLNKILATGTVSEVHASDLITGHNIVTNGALAGASGMPMFIQNSGNGVLIQNAVIVNVEVQ